MPDAARSFVLILIILYIPYSVPVHLYGVEPPSGPRKQAAREEVWVLLFLLR